MEYNIYYDICAIIILALLMLFCVRKKRIPFMQNQMYELLIVLCFFAAIVDIWTVYLINSIGNHLVWLDIMASTVYFLLQYTALVISLLYIIYWIEGQTKRPYIAKLTAILPVFFVVTLFILNIFNGCIFQIHLDTREYVHGPWYSTLYLICGYYIVLSVIYVLIYVNYIDIKRKISVLSFAICIVVAMIMQYINPSILLVSFFSSVALVVLFVTLQNPEGSVDFVTGVYNRNTAARLFEDYLKKKKAFYVVVVAMDDFKFVNKTFGVRTGDRMLQYVGNYLNQYSHGSYAFRLGSDQFCLVCPAHNHKSSEIGSTIMERFRHPWIDEGVGIMMSVTGGCITCPEDANTVDDIMDIIDYMVIVSKSTCKGSIIYANDISLEPLRREKAVEKAVRLALDRNTLEVYYQPIFSTVMQRFTAAEALVRLYDDTLGWISPEEFIPIAERNGLILQLGEHVLRQVCSCIRDNQLTQLGINYIEINVSVVQCMQIDFKNKTLDIMKEYDVKPHQINLEITETAFVVSTQILHDNMVALNQQGVSFAMDDYGSGYANVGNINSLPFTIIKLDKLMIWDAFENERASITLRHTVEMLQELNLSIVAEGVETKEQQEYLSSIGCNYLQGYYYSKAVQTQEFLNVLQN